MNTVLYAMVLIGDIGFVGMKINFPDMETCLNMRDGAHESFITGFAKSGKQEFEVITTCQTMEDSKVILGASGAVDVQ